MDLVIIILIGIGLLFFTGGTIGIIRLPDFYCRLHASGKMDTLASMLIVAGIGLYLLEHPSLGSILVTLKIILIVVFAFLALPTATHAIVDSGHRAGLIPWQKPHADEHPEDLE
ncbi:monovalent cation/H(+) antiporter subunit G [Desulfohalobium retbaense]|uniref:Monovalent cation/proton antiporter, MnhG/PhaG subunit n=1 Tax=Desulfohalobium retbaense (strain ATCC 49708 / DSM 5692 / JCM 16813 / HR100) TaxID=485915 RepID=C8X0Y8_DESRD|nr:monovalent cation/H(+) antiporter subunit G [Desulfohalobium retbaense]ACV68085.1 monovalent cation/proton antiporter, MnhG/PhaG subunit [Desulfohalobium retbaense DSM 5692]